MSHMQHSNTESKKSSVFQRFFAISVHTCIVMVFVLVSALVVFLLFFKPAPVVSVPSMVGQSFVDAAVLLQEKNLYPFVTLEYTDDPLDKGVVIKQNIAAGTAVRSKRIITLTVSQGTIITEMPDYRGLLYNEAVQSIKAQSSGMDALLEIVSVQKLFQDRAAHVILGQKPAPGAKITGKNTGVSFVVSRGNPSFTSAMPDVVGLYFYEIYEMMENIDASFEFYISERDVTLPTENAFERKAGLIIGQDPAPGKEIAVSNARVRIGIRAADAINPTKNTTDSTEGNSSAVVDILHISLPSYKKPHEFVIRKRDNATSDAVEILASLTRGGAITIPYFVVAGAMYEVDVAGSTVWRYTVPQ